MAGDLRTALEALAAEIVAMHPTARVYIGASRMHDQGSPPRVILVPKGEMVTPGPDGRSGEDSNPGGRRIVAVREVEVEAHIWGAKLDGTGKADPTAAELDHLDAAELLLNNVICAAQKTYWGYTVRGIRGQWSEEEGQVLKLGFAIVLSLEFRISVFYDEDVALVTVATASGRFTT